MLTCRARTLVEPDIVQRRFERFSAVDDTIGDWSMVSVAFTAIPTSMLEIDPDWSPDNLELLRRMGPGG